MTDMGNEEIFAKQEALARLGGDTELLVATVEIFLQELPNMVSGVERSLLDQSAGDLRASAHTLKGAASNIGAAGVMEVAFELEKLGASGGLSGAAELFESLTAETQKLEPVLAEFISCADVT